MSQFHQFPPATTAASPELAESALPARFEATAGRFAALTGNGGSEVVDCVIQEWPGLVGGTCGAQHRQVLDGVGHQERMGEAAIHDVQG